MKLSSQIIIIKCIIFVFSDTLKIYDKKSSSGRFKEVFVNFGQNGFLGQNFSHFLGFPTSPPCCPPHPWITSIPFAAIGSKQTTTYGTKKGYFFANDCVDQNTTFFFSSSFPSSLVMAINLNKLAVWTSYNAWFWSKGKKTTLSLSFILFIQNGWTDLFPLCDWSMI